MLLLPFLAGAFLRDRWDVTVGVSALTVLLAFVAREPLTVLARQRWVWRTRRPESVIAKRNLMWQAPALAACGAYLLIHLPHRPLLLLGAGGALLTGAAVWMAVHNRSRSLALQLVSALALACTALLPALSHAEDLAAWFWPLWAMIGIHGSIGVVTVHARLEQRLKSRKKQSFANEAAVLGAALLGLVALAAWWFQLGPYATPLAFSAVVAAVELVRLRTVGDEPFTRVGIRMLLFSLVHAALVVGVLLESSCPPA